MQLTGHELAGRCRGRRKDTDGIIKNGDCARYSQWKKKELMSYGGKDLENGGVRVWTLILAAGFHG